MINGKRRIFIEKYLQCWSPGEAAEFANYKHPRQQGSRLLTDVDVKAEIKRRIEEIKVDTDELLTRLADRTRLDMGDFEKYRNDNGTFDLKAAKEDGVSHLIKKIKLTPHGEEVQFHSVDFAIEKLGKNLGMFDDTITVKLEKELSNVLDHLGKQLDNDTYQRVLTAISKIS